MKIIIVGSGKLAKAILSADFPFPSCEILPWESGHSLLNERAILVHAGSGRQLKECVDFCERTNSVFIELSTGLETEKLSANFTLIICPNTSILVLKILHMMKLSGRYFEHDRITILESHQASKKSSPGTAFSFANSLNLPLDKIISVRDPEEQQKMGIPSPHLDGHAYHKIIIQDGSDEVTIETKVMGHDSYTHGVKKIIKAVMDHTLEKRRYSVFDLIDKDML